MCIRDRPRTAAEEPGDVRRPAHVTGPRGRLPFVTWTPRENRYGDTAYRRVGRSGLQLPTISLGLWNNFGDDRPLETQRAILRRAFDPGITHFDLANNYGPPPGSAEANFGRIPDTDFRGYRDELVLSTKAGYDMWPGPYGEWGSRKYLLASLDQSLRRMGVDYVDIFYSHRFDPDTPLEETMGALDTAVRVEDVDVIDAHPAQALVEAGKQVLAGPPLAVRPGPHVIARLRRQHELVPVATEVGVENAAKVGLRGARRRTVVVSQVEVRDTEIERAAQDRPLRLQRPVVAEVVPQAEGDRGQLQPAAAHPAVGRVVVPILARCPGHKGESAAWAGDVRRPASLAGLFGGRPGSAEGASGAGLCVTGGRW